MRYSTISKIAAGALAVLMGCGPGLPDSTKGSDDGTGHRIASGDAGYDGPAHKFKPRSHPPHGRMKSIERPDPDSLPPLVLRMGKCYGMYDKEEKQIAVGTTKTSKPKAKPKGKKGPQKPKGKIKAASGKRKKSPKRAGGGGGAMDDMLAGSLGSAPAGPPMTPPQPTPAPEAKPVAQPQPAPAPPGASFSFSESPDESAKEAIAPEAAEYEESAGADEDSMRIAGDGEVPLEEEPESEYEDWGAEIYLSNDDTMSLSSAQRVLYAIDNFLPLPLDHIRPHELLNYFSFEGQAVESKNDFSVLADIAEDPKEEGIYSLALSVRGRPVTKQDRRNVALTWVVDRSGSMHDEGRMDYLKRGLMRSTKELKDGDIVHMVLYDHDVCTPVENFVVGRDSMTDLVRAIDALRPMGATDIHKGLSEAYEIADKAYQPEYSNRLILITDALTNTGVTDQRMISMISKYYDGRRIRLSGVGVGRDFNDSLLDRLTERGKGAYVFLGSDAEVDAVFGPKFISLIETTALDVHFLLQLPPSLRMNVFYGEESSTVKEDVQAIHYFANTSQLFLSDLMARGGTLRPQDDVMLTVEYMDPESGNALFEDYAFNLGEIHNEAYNVRKAKLIMTWVDMLAYMAARPVPPVFRHVPGSWEDPEGWQTCDEGKAELETLAEGIEDDREVKRVLDLFDKYCSRYERPRNPVKRKIIKDDGWPGASETDPR